MVLDNRSGLMGQKAAAGFYQLVANASPGGGSFDKSTDVPVYWEWDATQTSWNTTTGTSQTEGSDYLVDAPNLGSAGAGTFTFNSGTYNPASGQGWVVADSLSGIKLYGGEASWKAPMTNGTTANQFAFGSGNYAMVYVVTWGGASSNDTFKKNNNSHHKFSGNNRCEATEIWHDQADGLGSNTPNSKVEPHYSAPTSSVKYMICFARGVAAGDLTTDNANVPGTHADGGKIKIWITPLASGNAWGTNTETADSLDESIADGTTHAPYSPSYLSSASVYSNTDTTLEHYLNESSVLHAYAYTNSFASESALETLFENIYNYAQGIWG